MKINMGIWQGIIIYLSLSLSNDFPLDTNQLTNHLSNDKWLTCVRAWPLATHPTNTTTDSPFSLVRCDCEASLLMPKQPARCAITLERGRGAWLAGGPGRGSLLGRPVTCHWNSWQLLLPDASRGALRGRYWDFCGSGDTMHAWTWPWRKESGNVSFDG